MLGMTRYLWLVLCAACGGAPSSAPSKSSAAAAPSAGHSIGQAAVAEGGLSQFGGGRNRSKEGGPGASRELAFERLLSGESVKLDGLLKEWPARHEAPHVTKGSRGHTQMAAAILYDDAHVWIGAEVHDEHLFRTSRFGDNEDHADLVLAFPQGSGLVSYQLGLFAGKPGESVGSVRFLAGPARGREIPGSRIVEAEGAGGYAFEAMIPWAAFAEASTVRVGLRGALRYHDSDGTQIRTTISTAPGDGRHPDELPALRTAPELSLLEGLLGPKGLGSPKFDVIADVAGDAMKERLSVYDRYVTIVGPHYGEGTRFFFRDIGGEVTWLEARDVTGSGKADILLRRRITQGSTWREWFEVWTCSGSDEPASIFGHEISVTAGDKRISNAIRVTPKHIEVSLEPTREDASIYRELPPRDVDPLLLPSGTVKSRTYRFDGKRFMKMSEVNEPGQPVAAPKAEVATVRQADPPTPAVQSGRALASEMLAQLRRDRGIPAQQEATVDLEVNVAEDARPERVVLIGRELAVFGPGFRGGQTYASVNLTQFADAADIREVVPRDVNADGAAELIIRGARYVQAQGSGDKVTMDVMFVYEASSGSLRRAFGIETAREQSSRRVQGLVQFVPAKSGRGFDIEVRPGMAKGWNEKTYPWQEEARGGALEPLLLPWSSTKLVRYEWVGSQFIAK